ncbi:SUMF1/EgtB/PvdO family nonheme iron enzyme, partial [Paenibacillus sp. MCAF20]
MDDPIKRELTAASGNAAAGSCCCQVGRGTEAVAYESKTSDNELGKMSAGVPHEGMVLLKGGSFLMGTEDREGFPADGEGPIREVTIDPFYVSPYAVKNAEFAAFVADTGYRTDAERFGWSYVFHLYVTKESDQEVRSTAQSTPWWWV